MSSLIRLAVLFGFVIASSTSMHAATVIVEMRNNFFLPEEVTINVGDMVTWVQRGSNHDTVSYDGIWASEFLRLNQTFSFTFNNPGDFRYYCTPHEQIGMIGTIHVVGGGNTPPVVSLTAPANGATFLSTDTITFGATASDNGGVTKVEFFAAANLIGTDTTAPYSVTGSLAAGSHTITARATDNAGATTTSSVVTITINGPSNQLPAASLTSPEAGVLVAPANIVLRANASDSDGSVAQVEFFNGTTSLGVDTAAPYEASLSNVAAGVYSFTAVAKDNAGAQATSSAVAVSVASEPRITSVTRNNSLWTLNVEGTTGVPHVLETTVDFTTWSAIATNTPAAGVTVFSDSSNEAGKIYRVIVR